MHTRLEVKYLYLSNFSLFLRVTAVSNALQLTQNYNNNNNNKTDVAQPVPQKKTPHCTIRQNDKLPRGSSTLFYCWAPHR